MRVSQLARKLNVLPADVLAALPQGAIAAEGAYNARLTTAQVEEVVRFFRPGQWEKFLEELKNLQEETEAPEQRTQSPAPILPASDWQTKQENQLPDSEPENSNDSLTVQQPASGLQEVEVIRAPKVELPGLRVVGKIEIPEKKKQETQIKQEQPTQSTQTTNTPRRENTRTPRKHKRQPRLEKNPIAVARERAKRDAERKRRKEAELEKQRKTERYLKKIAERRARLQQRIQTKSVTERNEPVSENRLADLPMQQLTWWQRFKKWLFRE